MRYTRRADIGARGRVALMAAHGGLVSFASDDAHPWREFIAALHGLFHVEVVVRGNAGHFAAMACAAFSLASL